MALLLTCLLLLSSLAGCNKSEEQTNIQTNKNNKSSIQKNDKTAKIDNLQDGSKKMGRYMEKKVEFPDFKKDEMALTILENSSYQIELYTRGKGKYFRYTLEKDMTWKSSEPGWLNDGKLTGRNKELDSICFGQDGNYYAVYTVYDKDSISHIIKSTDGGKTAQEIDIPYLKKEQTKRDYKFYPTIQTIKVLKDGNLVLFEIQSSNLLQIFSPEGEKLDKVSISNEDYEANYMVYGNDIIAAADDNKSIMIYNTVTKQVDRTIDYEVKSHSRSFAVKEDGTVLVGDSSGIHRIRKNGTLWETPVDGVLNSMSMPTIYFRGLFVKEGGQEEYFASYTSNDDSFQLLHYVYDKDVSAVPAHEITVYSLQENKTIRQAISMFQSKNADIKVNYTVAMGEEGGSVSDYIRALNTELLAGNGADILLMDGLPVASYLEKGVLTDYCDVITQLAKSGELLPNITKNYEKDGKVYQMPLRFGLPVILGDTGALSNVKSMDAVIGYVQKNTRLPYTSSITYKEILQNYLALYSGELFKNGLLDQQQLEAFLEKLKKLADNSKAKEQDEENDASDADSDFINSNKLFRSRSLGIVNHKYVCELDQINGFTDLMIPEGILKKQKDMDYTTINQMFLPKGMVGLNHASKEPDIAKQFISYLYSQEVQDVNLYDGFPVNLKSLQKWNVKEEEGIFSGGDNEGNEVSGGWPSIEKREAFMEKINGLTVPIEINQIVDSIIIKEAIPFFAGKISAQQAAAAANNKINTYLSE
jgi:ABC-type sugar transport system, periplasmic component